eukprot:1063030-Rhodomonas_salina.1
MHPGVAFSEDGNDATGEVPLAFMQAAWRQSGDMECHYPDTSFLGLPAAPFPDGENDQDQGQASKKRRGFGGSVVDRSPVTSVGKLPSDPPLPPAFVHDYEGEEAAMDFLDDEAGAGSKKDGFSRMTEFINVLASRGTALTFDQESGNFHVQDGAAFQKEYCALRSTRGKKNVGARDRPFAQMYRAYVMVRGDKWASKGTIFRAKDPKHAPQCSSPLHPTGESNTDSVSPSHQSQQSQQDFGKTSSCSVFSPHSPHAASDSLSHRPTVQAHDVIMQIRDVNGEEIDLSLQHFLDVTGAGALYMAARGRGGGAGGGVPEHFGCGDMQVRPRVEQEGAAGAVSAEGSGAEDRSVGG